MFWTVDNFLLQNFVTCTCALVTRFCSLNFVAKFPKGFNGTNCGILGYMLLVTRRMAFLTDKSRVFFAFSISIAFLWQLKGLHEKTRFAKCRTVNVWCKPSFSFPGRQSIWEITGTVGKIDKIATKGFVRNFWLPIGGFRACCLDWFGPPQK